MSVLSRIQWYDRPTDVFARCLSDARTRGGARTDLPDGESLIPMADRERTVSLRPVSDDVRALDGVEGIVRDRMTDAGTITRWTAVEWALSTGKIRAAVIDTWENEPHPAPSLLRSALIATPHVAGYSADGKANGTRMSLEAVARHFGLAARFDIQPPALPSHFAYGPLPESLARALPERALAQLRLYNPLTDTNRLRAAPEDFEQQRGNYPLRREEIR